jgi:glycosyltransferase involved in cell wall biosynthesis
MTARQKSPPLVTIVVPVYNEERTLRKILDLAVSLPIESYEVIVVDDASADKSPQIIQDVKDSTNREGVVLQSYRHSKNRGKGAGIKTALQHATGTYFVVQDADLEYDVREIPNLLNAAKQRNAPVVYGSRLMEGGKVTGMARTNYVANKMYNFLLRRFYSTNITDMHTCYKMVKTEVMKSLTMKSEGFDYATELVSKLLKRGYEIHEVPIAYHGRSKKEGKKIGYADGVECVYKILKYRFTKTA